MLRLLFCLAILFPYRVQGYQRKTSQFIRARVHEPQLGGVVRRAKRDKSSDDPPNEGGRTTTDNASVSIPVPPPVTAPDVSPVSSLPLPDPTSSTSSVPVKSPEGNGTGDNPESENGSTFHSPFDPACDAAANYDVFVTPYSVRVEYVYEVLTRRTVLLKDATEYVEDCVKNLLIDELVNCEENSPHVSPVRGVSSADPDKFAGGQCVGIPSYDVTLEACYVVKGSSMVYLVDSASLTKQEVRAIVWERLKEKFKENGRRRLKPDGLLNAEKGVLGVYFVGGTQTDSSHSLKPARIKRHDEERSGMRPGWGAVFLGVAFFVSVILAFAVLKQRGQTYRDSNKKKLGSSMDQNKTLSFGCSSDGPSLFSDHDKFDHPEDFCPPISSFEDEPNASIDDASLSLTAIAPSFNDGSLE